MDLLREADIGRARAGLATPVGPVWVEVEDAHVVAVGWGEAAEVTDDVVLTEALAQLEAYFDGRLRVFDLPIRHGQAGLSGRLLEALTAIEFGETREYGDLARALDAPAQAIGQACGANGLPILIPCHRVLSAAGLGGYSGAGGVETKVWLLRHEGAAGLLI